MTKSLNVTPKTTDQLLIVRSGKSEAKVTNSALEVLYGTTMKLTTDGHEASRGLSVTQLLVTARLLMLVGRVVIHMDLLRAKCHCPCFDP